MKEILKFLYNGKMLSLVDYQGLKCGVYVEDKIEFTVTEEEKLVILRIFQSVLPTNDVVDLGSFNYNYKNFRHFMDRNKGLSVFYEVKDNVLVAPSSQDIKVLNLIFNHQDECVKENRGIRLSDSKYYKRIVRFGTKMVIVFVSSALALNLYCNMLPKVVNESFDEAISYTEQYDSYSVDEKVNVIISTIKSNPNLTQEEKNFFLSCPDFFLDNIDYFRLEEVINHLKALKVVYVSSSRFGGPMGEYIIVGLDKGIIKIYNATSFNDAPKSVLSHEFLHVFTSYENYSYGYGYYELVNTIINNKYFGAIHKKVDNDIYDEGYSWLISYAEILNEVLGETVVKNYYATADPEIVVSCLEQIIPGKERAIKLLKYFDIIRDGLIFRSDVSFFPEIITKIVDQFYSELKEQIMDYYEAKYNKHM